MAVDLLSLILPVYRQADEIGTIVAGCEAALKLVGIPHETLLVVNGPRDGTLERCQELAAVHPAVRTLTSERGWGRAVRRGIDGARGDLICFTNSARTAFSDLTAIIETALRNPGTVVKARRRNRDNWRRTIGSLLYNWECRALFGLHHRDVNGTPKVFPRRFERLLHLTRDDDLIDLQFSVICRAHGYPMIEVPVGSSGRHGGTSTTTYGSAIRMYRGALDIWSDTRRARSR